jgi:flavin reductase (DIM6/NTAB) family NADH-FMN oxidoreductase RutF
MPKRALPPSEALYPVPVVLVSSGDKNGSNIITIAWCGVVCSEPPLVSISIRPSRYSHEIISRTGDFVINIPDVPLIKKTDICGVISGRQTDKFKACSFTALKSSKVSSPMIEECPVNIECKVTKTMSLGTHDMFIAKVLALHADERVMSDNGSIDYKKAAPFVYNRGEYWDLGDRIGRYGFSSR